LTSRGFVYVKANRDLMKEASDLTVKQIENYLTTTKSFDWNELKNGVREVVSRYLFEQTRRRPMVMPVVMEVNQNRRPAAHKSVQIAGQQRNRQMSKIENKQSKKQNTKPTAKTVK